MNILARNMRIEMMRKRLNELAEQYPRTHPLVIACSQRLDKLLNEVQREMTA